MSPTRNALLSRLLPFSEATIDAMPRDEVVMHLERAIRTEEARANGSTRYHRDLNRHNGLRLAGLYAALGREQAHADREVA
jgi:hypothetical protein